MKLLAVLFVVLIVCAVAYLRFEQPTDWNRLLDSLKAPTGEAGTGSDSTNSDASATPATAATPATPPPPPKPTAPEYITPTTTNYTHSSHITDVEQPAQPDAGRTNSAAQAAAPKVFVPPNPLPAQPAWTWTTQNGKVYKDVIVQKVEADRVTIFYDQGAAVVSMFDLTSDIQSQLNFDPDLATQAAAARQNAPQPAAVTPAPSP